MNAWGASWGTAWGNSWGSDTPTPPAPAPTPTPLGGSKRRIRGPYSDPRIYEAYIARCIAEREAPRTKLVKAILKESLVQEVEKRRSTDYAERDALINENEILQRLVAMEMARRDLNAIHARQLQIERQIELLEQEEAGILLALFDDMED